MSKGNRKGLAVMLTSALIVGAATVAVAQQTDPTGPRAPMGQAPERPAKAIAQRQEWQRTGTIPPLPIYDHATGDLARNPDGTLKLVDLDNVPPPPTPPCATTARGCNPELRRG